VLEEEVAVEKVMHQEDQQELEDLEVEVEVK
jgi:hypothetical protein